jgi:hypothetical protein
MVGSSSQPGQSEENVILHLLDGARIIRTIAKKTEKSGLKNSRAQRRRHRSDRIWKTFYQLKQWDHWDHRDHRGYELL